MKHQPSTLAHNSSVMPRDTSDMSQHSVKLTHSNHVNRSDKAGVYFTRTAIFSALTTSFVGFGVSIGMAPAAFAATDLNNTTANNQSSSQIVENEGAIAQPLTPQPPSKSSSKRALSNDAYEDSQLDIALDALRLKKAVEQGIIDQSVLDDYSEQNLGIKKPNAKKTETDANKASKKTPSTPVNNADDSQLLNNDVDSISDFANTLGNGMDNLGSNQAFDTNENLEQQVSAVQQQGYQMMTPEEIDRELAAMDRQNAEDIDSINQSHDVNNINGIRQNDSDFYTLDAFDAPVATLNDTTPPIGLDVDLDATSLPAPSNLETLGKNETAAKQAETDDVMSRPINVSDSVSSGNTSAEVDSDILANGVLENDGDAINMENAQSGSINPDDYLPNYENDINAVKESIEQAAKPKTMARNKKGNIVKRLYNRFFNDGAIALPHVETTVYLQPAAADSVSSNTKPKLTKADDDVQPFKNIKAALDETTVQSVVDFTAALPRLRQTALDAAKAVGYYEVTLRLRQTNSDAIDVIIEKLGEPVRVDSRIVDIRGEGSEQAEFVALEKDLPPQEGDIFNHRVYKDSKAALESLSNTYGYFDQYWLNKSVDIILPDNTADVSLVYNTGERYQFDEVVFFTYDQESGTLTKDPEKLPVELSLLHQLLGFKAGDPFYRPAVTKFSNDLSATRYFNTVNVESILPPDERSEGSTLAFDNSPNDNSADNGIDGIDNVSYVSNTEQSGDVSNQSESERYAKSGETVNPADIAAIEFEADEETLDKLQAIKQKAERLSRLPSDRVLDEKDQETNSILGKISDSITNIAQKIFPDEKSILADENFVPPTLAGRKTPQEVLENKKVPLYVFVSANKPRDAQVGLGYGTDTGVRATAKIDYNLLNRKGYQAGAETEVSRITKNVAVYASRPWKHPLNDKLDARLTYEEEVIDQGEGNFDLSTRTLKAALARNIRRESGWDRSYSVRYRLDELETGLDEEELANLPVRFTSSKPKQQALLFGYGMSKTDVDSAANPTRGIRQYYSLEAGSESAFSDTDLAIVRAGVSGIYSFGTDDKHQVLGSLNTGYIWADDFYEVPYKLRFFAGGDQSIRGYDYESLSPLDKGYLTGGQILAVGSAEYNYEFRPGFRGAFFTDVGNAYDKDFETDTKVGVGVGIRWASPVGVVRVDVAAGVTEESIPVRLHLFIGSPL
ncbi:autotransporter assembly complex protein TamA [Psychrobacter sp. ANT_WB68]|uniref:autotransporter assembly complex protein TamA n=1 Tax=Psychrobacter sp. ANT_WB68 TaxID=2597355 RepID=UPI0011F2813F|nr:BamA/TamA family outer membrane protein [Psychrobacter sp. ANT_WB68]KAA0914131.1 BamA/TamA family outer membrane protein [Psychrobacter sp. ANT_WB68]